MRKDDALTLLNNMIITLQKARSNFRESVSSDKEISDKLAEYFNPYLFGKKCPLDILLVVTGSENFDPLFVYNMCVIFKQFEPLLDVQAKLLGIEIPNPELSLLQPFED